jgi:tetratricopeptide (TPR) repeat protein
MTRETARVSAVSAVPGEFDAMQLVAEGRSLTPQAAAALERALQSHPDDYRTHIKLLGYYGKQRYEPGPGREAFHQQVFWFIQNHPQSVLAGTPDTMLLKRDDSAAFEEGKALWLAQISKQPNNTTLLSKAAGYCTLSDEETAERLLRQAEALEPKSPLWPGRLGFLYQLEGNGPKVSAGDRQRWARKALAEYEAAAEVSTNKTLQHSTSADLAMTAFDAGEYDKARDYALGLLQRGQNKEGYSYDPSRDLHRAHLILGLLALRDGDTAGAEAHLLAMGRVSGSPSLDTFGPNMRLAQELLKAGRRDVVLAYFDECSKFWTFDQGAKLKQWKAQVQKGEVPDFGGNLVY